MPLDIVSEAPRSDVADHRVVSTPVLLLMLTSDVLVRTRETSRCLPSLD